MSSTTLEDFVPLARLALGDGYDGHARERWVRPLAQLLEAAARGVGHLSLSECPVAPGAPREFFAVIEDKVLLPRNARYWNEVRQRIELLHCRSYEPISDEIVAQTLDAILPRALQRSDAGQLIFDNIDQRQAVAALIDAPMGVLTGGPGTGKTTCVAVMLAIRKRIQPVLRPEQILLCAPTGKAACRLSESIDSASNRLRISAIEREFLCNIEAQTLHRALQWGPKPPEQGGPFGRGPERPLNQELVIVDEASMVDLYLMVHLLRALGPQTSLLLLGDADQLESVETGGVLAELVQRGAACRPTPEQVRRWSVRTNDLEDGSIEDSSAATQSCTGPLPGLVMRLRHSYRAKQSPWILELAALAKPGARSTVAAFIACCRRNEPNVRLHRNRQALLSVCREYWTDWRRKSRNWSLEGLRQENTVSLQLRRFQLLCGDNAQVEQANRLGIAELWGGRAHAARYGLPHGCPVLVTQNRVALGLANGDVGIAVGPGPQQAAQVVVFPGLREAVPITQLPTHQPAFAITIHKSQGSEWERVAIDLPSESEVLDRNLLYTAISRSSGTLDIYADSERALGSILEPVSVRHANAEHLVPLGTQLPLFDLLGSGPKRRP